MGAANKWIAPLSKKIDPVFKKVEAEVGFTKIMPTPQAPKPLAAPEVPDYASADRARAAEEADEKMRRMSLGRASTILSGGTGTGSDALNTARKRLLGS